MRILGTTVLSLLATACLLLADGTPKHVAQLCKDAAKTSGSRFVIASKCLHDFGSYLEGIKDGKDKVMAMDKAVGDAADKKAKVTAFGTHLADEAAEQVAELWKTFYADPKSEACRNQFKPKDTEVGTVAKYEAISELIKAPSTEAMKGIGAVVKTIASTTTTEVAADDVRAGISAFLAAADTSKLTAISPVSTPVMAETLCQYLNFALEDYKLRIVYTPAAVGANNDFISAAGQIYLLDKALLRAGPAPTSSSNVVLYLALGASLLFGVAGVVLGVFGILQRNSATAVKTYH